MIKQQLEAPAAQQHMTGSMRKHPEPTPAMPSCVATAHEPGLAPQSQYTTSPEFKVGLSRGVCCRTCQSLTWGCSAPSSGSTRGMTGGWSGPREGWKSDMDSAKPPSSRLTLYIDLPLADATDLQTRGHAVSQSGS